MCVTQERKILETLRFCGLVLLSQLIGDSTFRKNAHIWWSQGVIIVQWLMPYDFQMKGAMNFKLV